MKISVFAKGDRAIACLKAMTAMGFSPLSILNQDNDERIDRFAADAGISLVNRAEDILSAPLDLLILAGYTRILLEPLLSHARLGAINLHGGRLPDYRGASVMNWQIINGETECGIAVIAVDDGIDTGDILADARFPILETDTIREVSETACRLFPDLLVRVLRGFADGSPRRIKQDRSVGAYYHKRQPEDGVIRWNEMTAVQVHDFTRALTRPCPGAFTFIEGKKLLIWKTRPLATVYRGIPGRFVRFDGNDPVVMAKDRGIGLTEYHFEGMDPAASREILKTRTGKNFREW